ncbi:hypothetical protein P154DRAFT_250098 [Amniculicola lignicola CBS 123094]|uniref:Uncharacterized protein n=1 Tax=Amniculicola lignicola CBS 123094 TaxID=1392246 RepID=A0A6A5WGQ7_9PLEO|nr:hypothetical protein P154DRAFT_250098 [Amniculicola lignicola CBS 123094]
MRDRLCRSPDVVRMHLPRMRWLGKVRAFLHWGNLDTPVVRRSYGRSGGIATIVQTTYLGMLYVWNACRQFKASDYASRPQPLETTLLVSYRWRVPRCTLRFALSLYDQPSTAIVTLLPWRPKSQVLHHGLLSSTRGLWLLEGKISDSYWVDACACHALPLEGPRVREAKGGMTGGCNVTARHLLSFFWRAA